MYFLPFYIFKIGQFMKNIYFNVIFLVGCSSPSASDENKAKKNVYDAWEWNKRRMDVSIFRHIG